MTRTVLCLALSIATLFAGLMTAKLCSSNAVRGEELYRLHLANEMQAAHNELLAAEVSGEPRGAEQGSVELEPSELLLEVTELAGVSE